MFFVYVYITKNSKEISKKHEETITEFSEHENPILYDTENSEYKIICANKKSDKSIECRGIYFNNVFYQDSTHNNFVIEFKDLNGYQASFLSDLNSCNMTIFNSQYIICC